MMEKKEKKRKREVLRVNRILGSYKMAGHHQMSLRMCILRFTCGLQYVSDNSSGCGAFEPRGNQRKFPTRFI